MGGGRKSVTRNVAILSGDRVVTAYCNTAEDLELEQIIWDVLYTRNHVLFSSCSSVEIKKGGSRLSNSSVIVAHDCINGSAYSRELVPSVSNITSLQSFLMETGYENKLDPTNEAIPFDVDVMLFPKVKLKMNYHGCVDTLQEECKRWFDKHARDGTNKTARARFPCYTMHNNSDFVVTRNDKEAVRQLLMAAVAVPGALWATSCLFLVFIGCCIRIDDWGHFRMACLVARVATKKKPAEQRPRAAWFDSEDLKENEVLEKLIKESTI